VSRCVDTVYEINGALRHRKSKTTPFSDLFFYIWVSEHHKSVIYNKPTRCNSGSIVFINNYKYALYIFFMVTPCIKQCWNLLLPLITLCFLTLCASVGNKRFQHMLYMFRKPFASIIRSTINCNRVTLWPWNSTVRNRPWTSIQDLFQPN